MSESTTFHIERCLQRLRSDDPVVRSELLEYAHRRLKLLAARMFGGFPPLRYLEGPNDLLQEGMIRLWQSVEEVHPTTVAGFMGLAALQFRRSLCNLARKHFGRAKERRNDRTESLDGRLADGVSSITPSDDSMNTPEALMAWSEFHDAAGKLPEPERTAFDLLFYNELPRNEVAVMMNVSDRQVRRYWQSARRLIGRSIGGVWPDL